MILSVAFQIPLDKTFDYLAPADDHLTPEMVLGRRVLVSFGFKTDIGIVCDVKEISESAKLKPIIRFLDEEPLLTPEQLSLARWLADRYLATWGEALFACLPPGKNQKKSVESSEVPSFHEGNFSTVESSFVLTPDQKNACEKIHDALHQHQAAQFLLFGVAAAGKTEVYLNAIEDVLHQGKSVLYLVPEIGLAVQAAQLLKHRFGEDKVLFWRSDITPKERLQDWLRVKSGHVSVIVGPRSAILLPVMSLGLIVVDEEHDAAYKEDRKPRFHVREVAKERAQRSQAVVIFGSATPSLDVFKLALENKIQLLELTHRAVSTAMPHVHLVDLKKERMRGIISPMLESSIKKRLEDHEQVILFLNKRGFHRFLRCSHCGWVLRCDQCGIAMVEHGGSRKTPGHYQCSYCAKSHAFLDKCPECGQKDLFAGGYGTQRVEDELKEKFPWAKVLRWDRDATSAARTQEDLYQDFLSGKYDILIGTHVVTQGFNFPKVTLVGILDADGPLYFPDFRASERAFQTILQVAGRAGRALVAGDVIVQTKNPDHPAIQQSIKMDMKAFAEEELKNRDDLNYPPYSHLIQLTFTDKKGYPAEKSADVMIEKLSAENFSIPVGILGPITSKRKKAGKASTKVILKVPQDVYDTVTQRLRVFMKEKGAAIAVDVDPETL